MRALGCRTADFADFADFADSNDYEGLADCADCANPSGYLDYAISNGFAGKFVCMDFT